MKIWKWLIINRIREYKRLFCSMPWEIAGMALLLGLLAYQVWTRYLPAISGDFAEQWKLRLFFMLCLFGINLKKITGRIKPQIIIKPMTLFLFSQKELNRLFAVKSLCGLGKYLLYGFLLSLCSVGFYDYAALRRNAVLYASLLIGGALLCWNAYNKRSGGQKRFFQLLLLPLTVLGSFGMDHDAALLGEIFLTFSLALYTIRFWEVDHKKYGEDMEYAERLLTAQNFGRTVLLSQYAKEKIARNISPAAKESWLLQKYPLIWKSFLSVFRTGKLGMGMGIGAFLLSFCIYILPVFWKIPGMEWKGTRQAILMLGVFFCYQISSQTFIKQLSDLMEKRAEGLFLPVKEKKIFIQFSIAPMTIFLVMTAAAAILLRARPGFALLFFLLLAGYFMFTLFFAVKKRKAFQKLSAAFSLLLFLLSTLLFL